MPSHKKRIIKAERIFISFFAGEADDARGVFRKTLTWDGGWNRKMHVAAVKIAEELGAKSYALFKPMRAINVEDIKEEFHL